ncbi:MAG: BsuPI-related putative proteinase inhibitor [Chthoniobacterales bacterium]
MTPVRVFLPAALLLAACAAPRDGSQDTWGNRLGDMVDPVLPDSLQNRGPALQAELRSDPAEFPLAERREVRVFFTVKNVSKRAERLDFATTQRFDLSVIAPDGKRIFLWSEDRSFEPVGASVMVNPRERIEYEVVVPTRDMQGGGIYRIEAGLTGFTEISATSQLRPQ